MQAPAARFIAARPRWQLLTAAGAAIIALVLVLGIRDIGDRNAGPQPFGRQQLILGVPVKLGDVIDEGVPLPVSARQRVVVTAASVGGVYPSKIALVHAGIFRSVVNGDAASFPRRGSFCRRYHTWQMRFYEGCTRRDGNFCCYKLGARIYNRLNPGRPPTTPGDWMPRPVKDAVLDWTTQAGIGFGYSARARGTYVLGPIVISGYLAPKDAPRGRSFSQTIPQALVVCVSVPTKACTSAVNRTEAYWHGRWSH